MSNRSEIRPLERAGIAGVTQVQRPPVARRLREDQ
jgi:hypothetical protein